MALNARKYRIFNEFRDERKSETSMKFASTEED